MFVDAQLNSDPVRTLNIDSNPKYSEISVSTQLPES